MTNIALIYGGRSGEHEVSLRSAASVLKNLNPEKFNIYLIGITLSGEWFLQTIPEDSTDSLSIIESDEKRIMLSPGKGILHSGELLKIDCIIPVLHGTFGEDGAPQGLFEMLDIPYTGSTIAGSALGMDKVLAKQIWEKAGIPVAPYAVIHAEDSVETITSALDSLLKFGPFPVYVKPARSGSSVGVYRAENNGDLDKYLRLALQYDTKILIEPEIKGREIECSVIGNHLPVSFPPGEITPQGDHLFYDYKAKYIDPDGAGLIIPAPLSEEQIKEIRTLAEKAYQTLECRGFSRIDFFLENETNRFLLNEINTIPGFTSISMFSMLCAEGGLPYPELLEKLIELGIEEYNRRRSLKYSFSG